jgi:hypothetical protein
MSTLEDRVRAALTAKSDAVAFSMLTRSVPAVDAAPEPEPATVLPLPAGGPHRSRRTIAVALAVAAVLLVAFGAVALHRTSTNKTLGPAHIRPRSAIPWDKVGTGWMLQVAEPGTVDVPGGTDGWLYLGDPDGVLYRICKVPQDAYGYYFPEPTAWGQPYNTDHVVLMRPTDNSRSSLLEINLRTGAQRAVTVQGHWSTAEFVDTTGGSILLNNVNKMVTVSAGTGEVETHFEGSYFYGGSISADRTQVITGSETAVSVLDIRTGRLVRRLASPDGFHFCSVNSWLSGGTHFIARCQQIAAPHAVLAFEFSLDGGTPPTRPAVPAGWDVLRLGDAEIAIKTAVPYVFRTDEMAFARLSPAGQLEPLAVPAAFKRASWAIEFVTPTGLILENASPDRNWIDDMVSWNPLTGQVTELFRRVDHQHGPDGLWAGWRASSP